MDIKKRTTREILKKNLAHSAPARLQQLKIHLHDVRSMHNVGAAFRAADAFGISEIFLTGFTPTPPRAEITKTAIGAEKYVKWNYHEHPETVLKELKKQDYHITGAEQTSGSILLPDFEPPPAKPVCVLFGNEVTGIDEELFPYIDTFVEIPQFGHKHSLNVSVTVGVVLYAFLEKFRTG